MNGPKGLNDYVSNRVIDYLKERDDTLIKLEDKIEKIQNNINKSGIYMCDKCKFYFECRNIDECDNCGRIYCSCKEFLYCEYCDCDVCETCFINDKNKCNECEKEK